jgi:hypothetical protein
MTLLGLNIFTASSIILPPVLIDTLRSIVLVASVLLIGVFMNKTHEISLQKKKKLKGEKTEGDINESNIGIATIGFTVYLASMILFSLFFPGLNSGDIFQGSFSLILELIRTAAVVLILLSFGFSELYQTKIEKILSRIRLENRQMLTVAYTTAFDERDETLPKTRLFLEKELNPLISEQSLRKNVMERLLVGIKIQLGFMDESQRKLFSYVD